MNRHDNSDQSGGCSDARERPKGEAIGRAVLAFVMAWFIFGCVAHVLIPLDSTGNPVIDAETARSSRLVGVIVLAAALLVGVAEYTLRRKRPAERAMSSGPSSVAGPSAAERLSSDELRTLLAGQRTHLAWIRTALALMGFGFLVARFGLFLRQIAVVEESLDGAGGRFSLWMGTALVLLGVAVNALAAVRHRQFMRRFESIERGRAGSAWVETGLAVTLAVLGLAMAVYLVATAGEG